MKGIKLPSQPPEELGRNFGAYQGLSRFFCRGSLHTATSANTSPAYSTFPIVLSGVKAAQSCPILCDSSGPFCDPMD